MTNDIGDLHHVVWPWTTVEIQRAGLGSVCADANTVMFVALSPALLERLRSPLLRRRGGGFTAGHVWCSATAWLAKEFAAAAAASQQPDALRLEEMALRAVVGVLGGADMDEDERPHSTRVRQRVEAARTLLSADLDTTVHVTTIAHRLDVSPFHLARQFRTTTGTSMYAYRQHLRARRAMRQVIVELTRDLSAIAAEHGFASHSHMTATCRRMLSCTPTAARKGVT